MKNCYGLFVSLKKSYVEAPAPSVTVFSHKDFWEVIKIQLGHKVRVRLSPGSTSWPGISRWSKSTCRSGLVSAGGLIPFRGLFLLMGFFPRGLPSEGRAGLWELVSLTLMGLEEYLGCQKDMVSYISHSQGWPSEAGFVAIEKIHFGGHCFPMRNLIFLLLSS